MAKKTLNQNAKYVHELIGLIDPDFEFENKPINRFKINNNDSKKIKKSRKYYSAGKSVGAVKSIESAKTIMIRLGESLKNER